VGELINIGIIPAKWVFWIVLNILRK
jgi:hypothetical protein